MAVREPTVADSLVVLHECSSDHKRHVMAVQRRACEREVSEMLSSALLDVADDVETVCNSLRTLRSRSSEDLFRKQ